MQKLKNCELGRKTVAEFKNSTKTNICVILDNIRSLNNIGSVFRTSDAFLVRKIFLCGITAQPPHNEIRKTALGADKAVDWEFQEDANLILKKLKAEGWIIISIEQARNSVKLHDFKPKKQGKYALIFGNEVKGVQQLLVDKSDFCIEIPQEGTKHSLNISVSAGVVLWDFFSKMTLL